MLTNSLGVGQYNGDVTVAVFYIEIDHPGGKHGGTGAAEAAGGGTRG